MSNIQVIVSLCYKDLNQEWLNGHPIEDEIFASLEAANEFAEGFKSLGVSVIVRPTYNETDSTGRFFREWRSFNGEAFKESRWNF
jgi:hypothetical protein